MVHFVPSNSVLALVAAAAVVVSTITLLKGRRRTVRGCCLPPGPPPLPIVGNIFSIDAKKLWTTYAEWATHYAIGDIFMIRVLNQDIIVINSKKIAKDLLDRRSSIYSDRPFLAMRESYGWSFNFALEQYGNQWRSQRRIFHQAFRAEASLAFRPIQLRKARQLVLDILNTPHDYSVHIQRFAAAVIMSIVYDYDVAPDHDHLVELLERGSELSVENLTPETAAIVEAFPFVLSLPEWFPGITFSRKAAASRYCTMRMIAEPFEHAEKREAAGSDRSAIALDLLRGSKYIDDPSHFQLLKNTCATALVAGGETTMSTLRCFMLAMLQHPEVQERAQSEIDAVVGTYQLPDFDDGQTYRLPHATTVDDIYGNFFIPKGCTVVANIWAMHHNEDDYPEPEVFKPERFLVDGKLDEGKSTDSLAFGFGRRVCPGRYTADGSLWAAMVSILAVFKITKAVNERGEEVDFEPTFSHGVTLAPYPFPCSITPRSLNNGIHERLAADI